MTHPASGNPTWQDYPNTSTLVTAATLEAIENALDAIRGLAYKTVGVYDQASAQAIASGGSANLALATTSVTSAAVTRSTSGAGHTFALGKQGLWIATAYCRMPAGGSAAFTALSLVTSAVNHVAVTNAQVTSGIAILTATSPILAALNDTVTAAVYHERGTSLSTVAASTGLRLAYVGPVAV